MLSQADQVAVNVDLGEPLLPVWIVRPVRVRVAQVPVLDAPMHAVAVRASDYPHAVRVAHDHGAAAPGHVPAHAVAGVLADDRSVEDLERTDLDLASLVDELDAVGLELQQLVEGKRIYAGELRRPCRQVSLQPVLVVAHRVDDLGLAVIVP